MSNTETTLCLVIGANSAIAQSLTHQQLAQGNRVVAVSRTALAFSHPHLTSLVCDNSESDIEAVCARIAHETDLDKLRYAIIFNGLLHNDKISPEKRLEHINQYQLVQSFQANSITPALWMQHLLPILQQSSGCHLCCFSARVGSINDNRLGGWYSYRASKAALNMLVKTFAIEYARRAKKVKLVAFHPGTTDTLLSQPFQKNVSPEALFKPAFVAEQLLANLAKLPADQQASYIDWQGKNIDW
ncbi:SDR family NAD(P)-dependent oxidoreductase [Motilimonas pumila]|uniref:SDR family NAD(P)-dependent oxidoreductase n=1 Tax=Motilimonas pumila TaxID=2303987 RepID=A0A418YF02_9GAMM|nr:SDR family NAD(P)-dependent oxidoreductase [Motilimonas pumila]RJG47781.1 SDR family NAD(P)-dependent oxidoreductase [Motilimonas pumila]